MSDPEQSPDVKPPASQETDSFNPVFAKLFAGSGNVTASLAYALYKIGKRQWVQDFKASEGRNPTDADFRQFASTQTDATLNAYIAQADQILGQFIQEVIKDARPNILAEALRGNFWRSFWPSFWASLAFTAVLLIIVLIAVIFGFGLPVQIEPPSSILN